MKFSLLVVVLAMVATIGLTAATSGEAPLKTNENHCGHDNDHRGH
jgi:hypothetical protein